MTNNSLVSIVVPIYNAQNYLEKCISSIAEQTYRNLEIILVDDGSTDNSPAICDEWAENDSRIKVIHKQNQGAGLARNAGIDNASGEYICFFDSDDYIHPALVEKCVAKANETGADVVLFGKNNVCEASGEIKPQTRYANALYTGDAVQKELLSGLFSYATQHGIGVWSKFFKLSIIKNNSIKFKSEREFLSEDAFFVLEYFSKAQKCAVIKENLYNYLERSGSLSRNIDQNRQEKNNRFLTACVEYIDKEDLPSQVKAHLKAHLMARYHIYTITALKQINKSTLAPKQKRKAMQNIYKDKTLNSTLTSDVLTVENKNQRMFFACIKHRLYFICNLLLKLRG